MGKSKTIKFASIFDPDVHRGWLKTLKPIDDAVFGLNILEAPPTSSTCPELPEATVDGKMVCLTCGVTFPDVNEQRQHYKLDWHRYNLKQKLMKSGKMLSEAEWETLVEQNSKRLPDEQDDLWSLSGSEDDDDDGGVDEDDLEEAQYDREMRKNNHPKGFFVREDDRKVVSVFKCLCARTDEALLPQLTDTDWNQYQVAILMLGGGHFAGAVFRGSWVMVHKTFHCYTVRAKQGGSQSGADNRSGTSHPKSAGASLRRYNQAALEDHVRNILATWAPHLSGCHRIFLRAVGSNRPVLFSASCLDKADARICTIPFATRRATFTEIKRVHGLLCSLEIHPDSFRVEAPDRTKRSPVKSHQIHRSKSRGSPHRPLPRIVQDLADQVDGETSILTPLGADESLAEFEHSPIIKKNRNDLRKAVAKRKDKSSDAEDLRAESSDHPDYCAGWSSLENDVVTSCKTGDLDLLEECLCQLAEEDRGLDQLRFGDGQMTPLHLAAKSGQAQVVLALLRNGADPTVRDRNKQVPYSLAPDKETRNAFRRFHAEHPDRFDYSAAQIPTTNPLTEEEVLRQKARKKEKSKAKKEARTEKQKAAKLAEQQLQKEMEERTRFLQLSDREKRALAAERRILSQSAATGQQLSLQRCFFCATDITGQVPFVYYDFKFCSPACVRQHRAKSKEASS